MSGDGAVAPVTVLDGLDAVRAAVGQDLGTSDWVTVNTFRWMRHTAGSNYQVAVRARSSGSTNHSGEATATATFLLQ